MTDARPTLRHASLTLRRMRIRETDVPLGVRRAFVRLRPAHRSKTECAESGKTIFLKKSEGPCPKIDPDAA